MEGRRKTRPLTTASRIDLPEYENSLLPISTYPNISAFTERGQIVIGYMELSEPWPSPQKDVTPWPCSADAKTKPSNNCLPASTWLSPAPPSMMSTWTK